MGKYLDFSFMLEVQLLDFSAASKHISQSGRYIDLRAAFCIARTKPAQPPYLLITYLRNHAFEISPCLILHLLS